jgi:valyl-tRNA synthetase
VSQQSPSGSPRALLDKTYEPKLVEAKWYPRWEKDGNFIADPAKDGAPHSIVIPPPNVTGSLHIGHALNNTLQDILTRWRRMKGDNAVWIPGCDHAGIATQNVVEKQLMAEGKSRHDLGREAFIDRVWEWKAESGGTIMQQLRRLGASCDWSRERFTMDEGLSKAVREVFVSLYDEGLIYRGDYIVNWCPRCESALSDLEVEHEDKQGAFYHLRYRFKDRDGELVVATTRPETLLGDTAVAVHPDDERYKDLIGSEVILPLTGRPIPIIADDYVDLEFGTGALKVTPGHDPNDFELGKRHNLPILSVMDTKGIMVGEAVGPYAGLSSIDCRKKIVADLKKAGLLADKVDHRHSVGHCYRCKTVIEPMVSTQWFVAIDSLAKPAIDAVKNGDIKFHPDNWKNTYFDWMENIRDWCISRQIWWGHRIPAWHCPCGHITVSRTDATECGKCGGTDLRQETDVLDTWFSSALWPFSTLGWPDKTPDLQKYYPTATLSTGFDILFFWVARMIMMGIKFMGEVPFKDVYMHALIRDSEGQKMSKSKGNVVDPLTLIDQYGADPLRFTMAAMASPGRDIRLAEERIVGYRNFTTKIWNAARFIEMNLPEDGSQPPTTDLAAAVAKAGLPERWIAGRLAETAAEVDKQLDDFRFDEAARTLYNFTWGEFCDWYLELSKPALQGDDEQAKAATRAVLIGVFDAIMRMLHPFMPFITEEIRSILPNDGGSIMNAPFPDANIVPVDAEAAAVIGGLMEVIIGVRGIRSSMNIPPSTELTAVIKTADEASARQILAGSPYLARMARITEVTAGPDVARPDASASAVWSGGEVYIPLAGRIDVDAEIKRLEGQLAKVSKELGGIAKKLLNPDFIERAPAHVVEKDRVRKTELAEKEAKLKESLVFMADLKAGDDA